MLCLLDVSNHALAFQHPLLEFVCTHDAAKVSFAAAALHRSGADKRSSIVGLNLLQWLKPQKVKGKGGGGSVRVRGLTFLCCLSLSGPLKPPEPCVLMLS